MHVHPRTYAYVWGNLRDAMLPESFNTFESGQLFILVLNSGSVDLQAQQHNIYLKVYLSCGCTVL